MVKAGRQRWEPTYNCLTALLMEKRCIGSGQHTALTKIQMGTDGIAALREVSHTLRKNFILSLWCSSDCRLGIFRGKPSFRA